MYKWGVIEDPCGAAEHVLLHKRQRFDIYIYVFMYNM